MYHFEDNWLHYEAIQSVLSHIFRLTTWLLSNSCYIMDVCKYVMLNVQFRILKFAIFNSSKISYHPRVAQWEILIVKNPEVDEQYCQKCKFFWHNDYNYNVSAFFSYI